MSTRMSPSLGIRRITKLRSLPGVPSAQDLRRALAVHRENCHQAGCLVLAELETWVSELDRGTPGDDRTASVTGPLTKERA